MKNSSNNNNQDDVYSAVIMAESLREFTWFMWWIQHGANRPLFFGPSQPAKTDPMQLAQIWYFMLCIFPDLSWLQFCIFSNCAF